MNNEFAKIQELVIILIIKIKIENESSKRVETENTFVSTISDVMQRIKEEFNKEKDKREDFEENIFALLEETCSKLVNNNSYKD